MHHSVALLFHHRASFVIDPKELLFQRFVVIWSFQISIRMMRFETIACYWAPCCVWCVGCVFAGSNAGNQRLASAPNARSSKLERFLAQRQRVVDFSWQLV